MGSLGSELSLDALRSVGANFEGEVATRSHRVLRTLALTRPAHAPETRLIERDGGRADDRLEGLYGAPRPGRGVAHGASRARQKGLYARSSRLTREQGTDADADRSFGDVDGLLLLSGKQDEDNPYRKTSSFQVRPRDRRTAR